MLADLIEVTTQDGFLLGGAYFAPNAAPTDAPPLERRDSPVDAVCFFHGDGGHFYRKLYLDLGARLAARGIAFLSANRRGHDIVAGGAPGDALAGYAHESVEDSRMDYAAWLDALSERGHKSVAIGGHSGGAVRATYAQSKEHWPQVSAVVSVSPGEYDHYGLIDLHGDEFRKAFSWCVDQVQSGRPNAYIRPGIPWGSTWSASAFLDCFAPDNRYSVTRRAADLRCPALFVFGSEECGNGIDSLPVCGAAMRSLKTAAHTGMGITVEVIDGANHGYTGRETQLFEAMYSWLTAL